MLRERPTSLPEEQRENCPFSVAPAAPLDGPYGRVYGQMIAVGHGPRAQRRVGNIEREPRGGETS